MNRRFEARATADCQAFPRLLNLFTHRGLLPDKLTAEVDGNHIDIRIEIAMPDNSVAVLLAEKMRQMVLVIEVRLTSETTHD